MPIFQSPCMKGVLTFITEKSMHMSGISQINQINLAECIGDGWVVLNKSPLISNSFFYTKQFVFVKINIEIFWVFFLSEALICIC